MITRIIFFIFILFPFAANAQMVVGELGVLMEPCPTKCGLIIADIIPESAADYAGLRPGDILVRINGENVYDDMTGVKDYIESNPEAIATLTISRDGSIMLVERFVSPL